MGHKQETGLEKFYRVIVPKATSAGAAVVVLGALFKIMHWPGAGPMLIVGLSTESAIFLMGLFQPAAPPEAHYEWENVYPELLVSGAAKKPKAVKKDNKEDEAKKGAAILAGFDAMMKEANLSPDAFKKFGQGIQSLNQTAGQMKNMGDAVTATNDYSKNLNTASKSLGDLNKAYSNTVSAMADMSNAAKDAKEYHSQVQKITKNLGALNAVYEMELKDADSHLKAMNKFYANLKDAMQNMNETSKESETLKKQMKELTTNLTTLNRVYGNMLTAMKG